MSILLRPPFQPGPPRPSRILEPLGLHAPRGTAAASLRVVAGAAVGTRERVVIVEVGSTWLVLGVAAGQVSRLHEMPRPPEAETTSTANATVPAPLPDFASSLKQMLDNRHAPR